ncbi:hypothetical protein [Azospirillum sp.]|uniref:hypothetical protein n=1 Tax=Azospirillum sp. TaxID=34012 RepID=UPI003D72436A
MLVTLAPTPRDHTGGGLRIGSPLLEIAQAINRDCPNDVVVEVLDAHGRREAVFGDEQDYGSIDLF